LEAIAVDAETITALTPICKYVLVFVLVIAVLYVLRDPLKRLVDRLITFKLKTKVVEAELSAPVIGETAATPAILYQEQVALEQPPTLEEELDLAEMEPASAPEWVQKMLAAFSAGDMEAAQAAFTETQQLEQDPVTKLRYEALYAFCRYGEGDTSALGELQQLAEKEGVAPMAYPLLAQCYENAGDFKHAASTYELAAQHADSEQDRAQLVVHAATCLFRDGKQQDAYTMVMKEVSELTAPEALSRLYEGLASLYELAKDPELRAFALEKALEFKPNDMTVRFRAAYSYGEKNLMPLALLHYKTLVRFDPDEPGSLNNLGVAYARLGMPIRAVESYQAAAGAKETLAAANLAEAYITAGFKREALEVIDQARKQEKVHARVGAAIEVISEADEAEADSEASYLEAAREQQRFLQSFAAAYFAKEVVAPGFAGSWTFADGAEAMITQTENEIEANWKRDNVKYKLTGQVNNRGARATMYKMEYGPLSGKELRFIEDKTGYVYLSPDDQELLIMTIKGHEHSFEKLTRCEGDF
jgi:Flp pilus assembly protein TadD